MAQIALEHTAVSYEHIDMQSMELDQVYESINVSVCRMTTATTK